MIHIRYAEDLHSLPAPLREWITEELPFIAERTKESDDLPEDTGWLVLLEELDDPANLKIDVAPLLDLNHVTTWEWIAHNANLGYTLAVVIISDGFGMAFCVPTETAKKILGVDTYTNSNTTCSTHDPR